MKISSQSSRPADPLPVEMYNRIVFELPEMIARNIQGGECLNRKETDDVWLNGNPITIASREVFLQAYCDDSPIEVICHGHTHDDRLKDHDVVFNFKCNRTMWATRSLKLMQDAGVRQISWLGFADDKLGSLFSRTVHTTYDIGVSEVFSYINLVVEMTDAIEMGSINWDNFASRLMTIFPTHVSHEQARHMLDRSVSIVLHERHDWKFKS